METAPSERAAPAGNAAALERAVGHRDLLTCYRDLLLLRRSHPAIAGADGRLLVYRFRARNFQGILTLRVRDGSMGSALKNDVDSGKSFPVFIYDGACNDSGFV